MTLQSVKGLPRLLMKVLSIVELSFFLYHEIHCHSFLSISISHKPYAPIFLKSSSTFWIHLLLGLPHFVLIYSYISPSNILKGILKTFYTWRSRYSIPTSKLHNILLIPWSNRVKILIKFKIMLVLGEKLLFLFSWFLTVGINAKFIAK